MKDKLSRILDLAERFMMDEELSSREIIGLAADVYCEHYDDFPEQLRGVFEKCVLFVNMDVEPDTTFEDYVSKGNELVEDLSGFLGEYFCD